MRRVDKEIFPYEAHYREHKRLLKSFSKATIYNIIEDGMSDVLIFYKLGEDDHRFMVRYGSEGPGDIDFFMLHPSLDNLKTLRSLTDKGKLNIK